MQSIDIPASAQFDRPHPIMGRIALAAIIFAMLAIVLARIEIFGTQDLEHILTGEPGAAAQACDDRLRAVALNRWATGFSP